MYLSLAELRALSRAAGGSRQREAPPVLPPLCPFSLMRPSAAGDAAGDAGGAAVGAAIHGEVMSSPFLHWEKITVLHRCIAKK